MTNERETLLNCRVLIFQGNWRYKGRIVKEGTDFFTILDERTGHHIMLNRSSITSMEVLQ